MIRHVAHFAGRLIHALAFFIWPFYVYSPLTALMWVLVPACSGSLVFMAVTQVAHLLEATIEGPSNAPRSWASQQIANACDFAPDSPLVARLTGGLNRQVEHHLFPTVHHSHLPELSSIVEAVTKRRGLNHHVLPSATKALGDHLAFLRSPRRRRHYLWCTTVLWSTRGHPLPTNLDIASPRRMRCGCYP